MPKVSKTATKAKKTSTTKKKTARKPRRRPDFPNYNTAAKYLAEHVDYERIRASRVDPSEFKLDRMQALMKVLDNPQEDLKVVHIAGTNGKGSTVSMLSACY